MNAVPEKLRTYWEQFVETYGPVSESCFYDAFSFADSEESANTLADLVVAGIKRATAGLYWSHEADGDPLPEPGNLSIVTMWDGTPRCVIETTRVQVQPFAEVDADFAATEGEGDGSLAYWRTAHREFFARECARIGRKSSETMPVVCEWFRMIYA